MYRYCVRSLYEVLLIQNNGNNTIIRECRTPSAMKTEASTGGGGAPVIMACSERNAAELESKNATDRTNTLYYFTFIGLFLL